MGKKSKKGLASQKGHHHGRSQRLKSQKSQKSMKQVSAKSTPDTTSKVADYNEKENVENQMPTVEVTPPPSGNAPPELASSLELLTDSQKQLATTLCLPPCNQNHLFEKWPECSTEADGVGKKAMMEQLESLDNAYPDGGMEGYIRNAKELLMKSKQGLNPLEGWTPSVPDGERLELGTKEYDKYEEIGIAEMGKCSFVLVAGGLGERLGYHGIKLGLPTELATETLYLQLYIETILSIQSKYAAPNVKLPLCIMVSNSTIEGTLKLLKENNNFGLDDDQITILKQGEGVPAVMDNNATFITDENNKYKIETKPHGHGDIHALLHSSGVAKKWCAAGLKWVIFCQDTNGLAFHTLALALGVSKQLNLLMNSIACPRKAKQAIGGIAKLKNESGEERTINVEYNLLDPLLRASGFPDGDVNDEKSGFSPFPGNINQLLFELPAYANVLDRTKGAMPEFVNPKYADGEKNTFKKPTRLECMMQEFPSTLEGDEVKRVGFTSIAPDLCFSPVKNAIKDGVALQQKGTHPGVAASGEADQYAAFRKIMRSIGCNIEDAPPSTFSGISVVPGPEIVLKPSFVLCPTDYKEKFPKPHNVKISSRSSLVVKGSGVVIESLYLDGALIIECEEGASGVVRDVVVKNKGWEKVVNDSVTNEEFIRIRGYQINKIESRKIIFKKDGTVVGLPATEENVVNNESETSKEKEVSSTARGSGLDLSLPKKDEEELEEQSQLSSGCFNCFGLSIKQALSNE